MIKWLCYKIVYLGNRYSEIGQDLMPVLSVDSDGHPDMEKSIRFAVLPARGGCIVETKVYDKKEREWDIVSHVIPEGADVAKEVGDIVAMELLRR